jgi:hypothetical protein
MPAKKKSSRRRYSQGASKTVASAMRRKKHGTLKSGKGGKGGTVKSRSRRSPLASQKPARRAHEFHAKRNKRAFRNRETLPLP